jgi:hypothetical protein
MSLFVWKSAEGFIYAAAHLTLQYYANTFHDTLGDSWVTSETTDTVFGNVGILIWIDKADYSSCCHREGFKFCIWHDYFTRNIDDKPVYGGRTSPFSGATRRGFRSNNMDGICYTQAKWELHKFSIEILWEELSTRPRYRWEGNLKASLKILCWFMGKIHFGQYTVQLRDSVYMEYVNILKKKNLSWIIVEYAFLPRCQPTPSSLQKPIR